MNLILKDENGVIVGRWDLEGTFGDIRIDANAERMRKELQTAYTERLADDDDGES